MLDTLDVVSVKLVLVVVVVVGVSTWYIKEIHPLIPWQIGEVLGTMDFRCKAGSEVNAFATPQENTSKKFASVRKSHW